MVDYDKSVINRLKRTEGQIRGIQRMLEEQKECADVVTQLSAVRSSVDRIMGLIVAENLKQCVENPDADPEEQSAQIQKAIQLVIKK
ncbi:MAG: metal-sensitive transcriptional regulator [Alkalibacterium sp.]